MTIKRVPSLSHWGAFTVVVEDGRVVDCEPFRDDPSPSPIIKSIPEMVHSRLRIASPVVREGWREGRPRTGKDRFKEISWDAALDLISFELRRVRENFGAEGIFGGSYGWSSAGRLHHARSLLRRFLFLGGGCVDQVGNYSWGAAQFILPHVIGTFQPVAGQVTDWPSIIKNTKLIIAFGGFALRNGQVSSGGSGTHTLERWLRRAKEAGIRFVVVSPLRSDAPDFLDPEWLPIRPNTDTSLLLAMAHTLVANRLEDTGFLARYCVGFDKFRGYLLGEHDGIAKTPEWAAKICGVDADVIRCLASAASATECLITCTWSLQRAHHGEQPYWASIALAAMLGGIGKPGRGFAFGHGSLNGVGEPRVDIPGPEMSLPTNPARKAIPVARIADMLLNPGKVYDFNGRRDVYPDIRLVYWAGGNPFHHHQDLNRFRRAWQKPETVIVNEIWWNPTARHADIVLPATTTLERNDVGGSTRDPHVFAMHKAIEPVGEARSDFEIFSTLAQRLGYGDAFTQVRDEMAWCRSIYERVSEGATQKDVLLPTFEEFWMRGYIALPEPDRDFVLFEDFRRYPDRYPLNTPSGRIEISSSAIASFGYEDCPPHPAWIEPQEWLGSTLARSWPLHLITHQPSARLHSQMDPGPVSRETKRKGREIVRINSFDAAKRDIAEGDVVRIFNARGSCLAAAAIDDSVMTGVIAIATGAWFDPDPLENGPERHGNPNVLTLDVGTSRLAQGPSALSALVEVERYAETADEVSAWTPPAFVPRGSVSQ